MRTPKKQTIRVKMCGQDWTVEFVPIIDNREGLAGDFKFRPDRIRIRTKGFMVEALLHEMQEATLVLLGNRLDSAGDTLFTMNHTQFSNVILTVTEPFLEVVAKIKYRKGD